MTADIRVATPSDVPRMVELLLRDAERRRAHNSALWGLADDASSKIAEAVNYALTSDNQPFQQTWLVAETDGELVGAVHSAILPVPPIYDGKWGEPGLLMPETFVAQRAAAGTLEALVIAAEADLLASGAGLLIASYVCDDELGQLFRDRGYEPVTLYLSKSGLKSAPRSADVRTATNQDIDGIVIRSAQNRSILYDLNPFWTPHAEADTRFGEWMKKSLTFTDRDMLVSGPQEAIDGYIIAQPAARLHFPPAHEISFTGVIDDFFHSQFADPAELQDGGVAAQALLQSAETRFAEREVTTAFVVCPAAWTSKIALLEDAGYRTAMMWMTKR